MQSSELSRSLTFTYRLGSVRCAALLALCSGLTLCSWASGATLSSQSSVGLAADYNSNPYLVDSNGSASEAVAVLADLPATYTSDWQSFDLDPRVRFAQTHGEFDLLSNYQYVDGTWRLGSERNTLSVDAGWHRDSTLYNQYENAVLIGHDLPRLEDSANLTYRHSLSERSDVQIAGSWDHVAYSENSDLRLDNFSSAQVSALYERNLSERWQWSNSAGLQHFDQFSLGSRSDNRFLQTSATGALSESWSLTLQGGYSFLDSSAQGYVCCRIVEGPLGLQLQYIPVQQRSSGGSLNYLFDLQHKSERLMLNVAASQAITPSGLGAVLKNDMVTFTASLPWTERLTFSAALQAAEQSNPLQGPDPLGNHRYYNGGLGATWAWTEHWSLALQTGYAQQRTTALSAGSNVIVNLTLSRQFGRLQL